RNSLISMLIIMFTPTASGYALCCVQKTADTALQAGSASISHSPPVHDPDSTAGSDWNAKGG
ncbi:MAG: hypothetical protein AAF299_16775, partial [Pseudomonadota bacterium]